MWWPNLSQDIANVRAQCTTCKVNAPSQQPMPPHPLPIPKYPFQLISSDYFHYQGHTYLLFVDRYSNWPVLCKCRTETAEELITALRKFFCTYGVPDQLASDGGPTHMADSTKKFLQTWNVEHRVSSSYHLHANLRAETAVKSIKRLIANNTGPGGSIDNDALAAALLLYRNTPDRDTQRSPAQILYSRQLKDALPCHPDKLQIRPEWTLTADLREKALAKRHISIHSQLIAMSKDHKPLQVGDDVQVQNQRGAHSNKWDLSGTIVEVLGLDTYLVIMEGTGRISKRNSSFLWPILSYTQVITQKLPQQTYSNSQPLFQLLCSMVLTI